MRHSVVICSWAHCLTRCHDQAPQKKIASPQAYAKQTPRHSPPRQSFAAPSPWRHTLFGESRRPHKTRIAPHNTLLPPHLIDDALLHCLDGHRGLVDAQHAGALAGCRAYAPRKLRKVIRDKQPLQGFLPAALIDKLIPFRYFVTERAPCRRERIAHVADHHSPRPRHEEVLRTRASSIHPAFSSRARDQTMFHWRLQHSLFRQSRIARMKHDRATVYSDLGRRHQDYNTYPCRSGGRRASRSPCTARSAC